MSPSASLSLSGAQALLESARLLNGSLNLQDLLGHLLRTVMGRLLARRALGASVRELGFPVTPVLPVPFHSLSGIGARAAIQYLRFVDGFARVRGRSARNADSVCPSTYSMARNT